MKLSSSFTTAVISSNLLLTTTMAASSIGSDFHPVGSTIEGVPPAGTTKDAFFEFGSVVQLSSDGNRMTVGAPNRDRSDKTEDNNNRGSVFVYERDGGNSDWKLLWRTDGKQQEGLGDSLAFSDDGNVVAIRRHDGTRDAVVYRYSKDIGTFETMGNYVAACDGAKGKTLSLGTTMTDDAPQYWLLVSCEYHEGNKGKVEIFRFDDVVGHWRPYKQLLGDDKGALFGFDTAVAADSDGNLEVGVSSPNFDNKRGMVQVFRVDGSRRPADVISVGGNLVGKDEGEQLGFSLDMSKESEMIVGSPQASAGGIARGMAQVFRWNNDASDWDLVGAPVLGPYDNNKFGRAVAISGDGGRIAASSIHFDQQAGLVQVLDFDGSSYEHVDDIVGDGRVSRWGYSVSLNVDGSLVASGATRTKNDINKRSMGSVQTFSDVALPPTSSPTSVPTSSPTAAATTTAPTSSPTESSADASSEDGKSEEGSVLGTVLGAMAGVITLAGAAFGVWKYRSKSDDTADSEPAKGDLADIEAGNGDVDAEQPTN